MTFQTLIATMNGYFFQRNLVIPCKYLVINQYKNKKIDLEQNNLYQFQERGLSKSRNHATENAEAQICHISDDDLEYIDDIEKHILNAFHQYPDADIITFQIKTPEDKPYKKYKNKMFWHTQKTLMGVSSVEIVFRLKSIQKVGLKFDEQFGLGSSFPTGEEIIFLTDALKLGLKIAYVPIPIVVHPIESSGKDYGNITLIEAKGAMFYRIFGSLGYPISILFSYKKYKYSPYTLYQFIRTILRGISKYRSIK